jgi:hypothetical protein
LSLGHLNALSRLCARSKLSRRFPGAPERSGVVEIRREGRNMLLLIIVLILLFGGGGGYYGYSRWGTGGGLGVLGTVLVIVVILYLLGVIR